MCNDVRLLFSLDAKFTAAFEVVVFLQDTDRIFLDEPILINLEHFGNIQVVGKYVQSSETQLDIFFLGV